MQIYLTVPITVHTESPRVSRRPVGLSQTGTVCSRVGGLFSLFFSPPQGPPEAPSVGPCTHGSTLLQRRRLGRLDCDRGLGLLLPVVCLGFGRRDVANGLQQSVVVEPRNPLQGG